MVSLFSPLEEVPSGHSPFFLPSLKHLQVPPAVFSSAPLKKGAHSPLQATWVLDPVSSSAFRTLPSQTSLGIQRGYLCFSFLQVRGLWKRWVFQGQWGHFSPAMLQLPFPPNTWKFTPLITERVHFLPKAWARPCLISLRNVYINY